MLACRRLYPGAVVALSGSLNRNVRDFYRLHADELDVVDASRIDPDAVTRLIVVDATDPSRLAELEHLARRPGVEVVWFDHHPEAGSPEGVVRSEDGALATTLVGILAERELAITPLEATVLALGIHEDTGSLTYATATERDVEALAWCLRHGARQEAIGTYLHAPLGEEERAVLDALLSGCSTHRVGGLDVLVAGVSWPSYVDGVSNLAHKLVDLTDCRALVCLAEMDRRVVCVVRSRTPAFDASKVAVALGGGGHPQAASATYHGSLIDARTLALAALQDAVEPATTAGEIMSTPPRFVASDDTVAHAMALCQRHRQSGVEVGDARRLVGVVTREDLDKAIGHGLSHAPVKAVASPPAGTCDELAPLGELQRLLTASGVGRVPVVGGFASAARGPGGNRLVLNGQVFTDGAVGPRDLSMLRIPGVLQRIAVCYLAAALLYLYVPRRSRHGAPSVKSFAGPKAQSPSAMTSTRTIGTRRKVRSSVGR